jgi:peptide/nickel transport system permease protein
MFVLEVLTAATINFVLPHLSGRDPVGEAIRQQIAGQGLNANQGAMMYKTMTHVFGLDQPLWAQYLTYLKSVATFDFGYSIQNYPRKVMDIVIARARMTLPFLVLGIFISFIGGILLGAFLGWNKTPRWISNILVPPMLVFSSVPQFLVALVLLFVVSFKWRLLPLGGAYDVTLNEDWTSIKFILSYAQHAILPILSIVFVSASGWALGMRAMMVTVEGEDYTTFAEAKGLKTSRIFFRYLLRNAMLPSLTGLAITIGFIVTGSAVTENYFNYNGLGLTLGTAIGVFDYFMMYGIITIMVMSIALATFVMEMIYPLLDPRISYRAQRG